MYAAHILRTRMITCKGGGAGMCFVVSRRIVKRWPKRKSERLQCMGCITRKETVLHLASSVTVGPLPPLWMCWFL